MSYPLCRNHCVLSECAVIQTKTAVANRQNKRGLPVEGLAGGLPMNSPVLSSSQPVTGTHTAGERQYNKPFTHTSALWCELLVPGTDAL